MKDKDKFIINIDENEDSNNDLGVLDEVAKYLINCAIRSGCEGLSNLKLQKLVYYAQGLSLGLLTTPLFDNDICAWAKGSVCPDLYYKYKDYENKPIPIHGYVQSGDLTVRQCNLLDRIWNEYGKFSTWKLESMNKKDEIWNNNKKNAGIITHKEMREFFKNEEL